MSQRFEIPQGSTAQRAGRHALTRSLLLGSSIAIIAVAVGQTRLWRGLEERAQNLLMSSRAPRAQNPQVVVIEVDDLNLRRNVHAQIVRAAAGSGARVAAFDISFGTLRLLRGIPCFCLVPPAMGRPRSRRRSADSYRARSLFLTPLRSTARSSACTTR